MDYSVELFGSPGDLGLENFSFSEKSALASYYLPPAKKRVVRKILRRRVLKKIVITSVVTRFE